MNDRSESELIQAAIRARHAAYAPYSHFQVGAAIRTKTGIYAGCNVENTSFGLTVCAERAAVFHAVADGQRDFLALAVVCPGGLTPCGACRQVLAEFCRDLPIVLFDANQEQVTARTSLALLLPQRFGLPAQ